MKKVVKFGGSSLASARQFKKVADIIKSDKSRRYVVPSAPGKRSDKDEKVTDLLYACYDAVAEGRSYKKILEKIKSRYMDIIDGLDLNLNLDHEFDRIEENFLAKAGRDYAASRGEYLNGIVAANFLGFEFVDAAEVIFFDENGNFESEHTNRELSERLEHVEKAVLWFQAGRDHQNIFQRRFRCHRLHRGQGHPRRYVRELDGCVWCSGDRPQNRGESGSH